LVAIVNDVTLVGSAGGSSASLDASPVSTYSHAPPATGADEVVVLDGAVLDGAVLDGAELDPDADGSSSEPPHAARRDSRTVDATTARRRDRMRRAY
jgi:hypothetical protein